MPDRCYVLTHPGSPKSLNAGGAGSRQHWAIGYREKKYWTELWSALLENDGVPRGATHIRVDATIRWKIRRRRDVTNYIAPIVKPLADVFVDGTTKLKKTSFVIQGGWIPDDTDEFFTWGELTFEYPKPWTNQLSDSELLVRIRATYPTEPLPKPRTSVQFGPSAVTASRGSNVRRPTKALQNTVERISAKRLISNIRRVAAQTVRVYSLRQSTTQGSLSGIGSTPRRSQGATIYPGVAP